MHDSRMKAVELRWRLWINLAGSDEEFEQDDFFFPERGPATARDQFVL